MPEEETIRWQVPIPTDVADQIQHLADAMDLPRTAMAVMLVEAAVDARTNFADWLGSRITSAIFRQRKKAKTGSTEEIRLELRLPPKVADRIEQLAEPLGHTPVRMAALLLKAGADENSGIIEVVTSSIVRRALGKPPRKNTKNKE